MKTKAGRYLSVRPALLWVKLLEMLCSAGARIGASEELENKSDEGPDDILNEPAVTVAHMVALFKLSATLIALEVDVTVNVVSGGAFFCAYVTVSVTSVVVSMTKCRCTLCVTVLASLRLGAGSEHIVVTKCKNLALRYGYGAARGAVLTFGQAAFGTSRSFRSVTYLGMSECGNFNLSYGYYAAHGAVLTVADTALGTSGSRTLVNHLGVTECGNYLLSFGFNAAYATVLAIAKTAFGTGGRHEHVIKHLVVSECGNFNLSYRYGTAYGAMLAFTDTALGTSGCSALVCDLTVSGGKLE